MGTLQKIRRKEDIDVVINADAALLMNKSKKELGITGTFKEITIAKELSEKHNKPLTSDAVKARAYRTKRKKR